MRDIMFTTICLAAIATAVSGSLLIVDRVKADTTEKMTQQVRSAAKDVPSIQVSEPL
jgi:hypothetical protein